MLSPGSQVAIIANSKASLPPFIISISSFVWNGLYRKELFSQVTFPENKIYEDLGTTHRLVHAADRIYLMDAALYNYRSARTGSITTAAGTCNHPDKKEMHIRRINDLFSWGYDEYAQYCALSMLVRYGTSAADQKYFVEVAKKIKGFGPGCFTFKQKLMLIIFKISPALFDAICIAMGRQLK